MQPPNHESDGQTNILRLPNGLMLNMFRIDLQIQYQTSIGVVIFYTVKMILKLNKKEHLVS